MEKVIELEQKTAAKRKYIAQSDVPIYPLEDALRVPRAIIDNFAGRGTTPLNVASALNMSPTSGGFRSICGSAIAYGLTEGGSNAKEISVEPLAKRILTPTEEGDDLVARGEAALNPRVIGEFLRKYDGSSLPRQDIALNVLAENGVPRERVEDVYTMTIEMAQSVGFIRDIKGKQYVDLSGLNLVLQPRFKRL